MRGGSREGGLSEAAAFEVRGLREGDLAALLEIERGCFDDPWPVGWFREAIRSRGVSWGAFDGAGKLAGYIFAYDEENAIHLTNVAVASCHRRRGVARLLVERLLSAAAIGGKARVYLEVRHSNQPAIRLYESLGFRQTGVEQDYYGGQEDALILTLELDGVV